MTVYVDDVELPFRSMIMCHLWADTLVELFAMADQIGVDRKWLQGHPTLSLPQFRKASWVHFDIALSKKALAIKAGAVLTDKFGPVEFLARRDGDRERLARIARVRSFLTTPAAREIQQTFDMFGGST
jgi:hypothetical protein